MRPRAIRSSQLRRFKMIIGVNDLAQFVFARPVTAIGVGMQAFDEFFVARLDRVAVGGLVQSQRLKRLGRSQPIAWGVAVRAAPRGRVRGTSHSPGSPAPQRLLHERCGLRD